MHDDAAVRVTTYSQTQVGQMIIHIGVFEFPLLGAGVIVSVSGAAVLHLLTTWGKSSTIHVIHIITIPLSATAYYQDEDTEQDKTRTSQIEASLCFLFPGGIHIHTHTPSLPTWGLVEVVLLSYASRSWCSKPQLSKGM